MNVLVPARLPARKRPFLAVLGMVSLAALLFGLVAMHAGMVTVTDAAGQAHAMAAADAGGSTSTPDRMATAAAADHHSGNLSPGCIGMCDAGCAMMGTACMAGPVALTHPPTSGEADPVVLQSRPPRSGPAVARRLPPDRPPSLTALSISRI